MQKAKKIPKSTKDVSIDSLRDSEKLGWLLTSPLVAGLDIECVQELVSIAVRAVHTATCRTWIEEITTK